MMMSKLLNIVLLISVMFSYSSAQSYELNVINGYGSGQYIEEDTVQVWANTADEHMIFDRWEGNAINYLKLNEWHSTILVPKDINVEELYLKAIFKTVSNNVLTGIDSVPLMGEYNEDPNTRFTLKKELFYWIPQECKGIVFMFHGTGGTAKNMTSKYEISQLLKQLVDDGYAVFSMSSNESSVGDQNGDNKIRWVASPLKKDTLVNIDLMNVFLLQKYVQNELNLNDIPFFNLGVSNGAVFSDLSAGVFNFNGVAHIVGHGSEVFFEYFNTPSPTIWLMAENDHQENADNEIAFQNYMRLQERQIATEWFLLRKSPLYAQRFTRSNLGISLEESVEIVNELLEFDLIDEKLYLRSDDLENDFPLEAFFSEINLNFKQKSQVIDQLKIVNADHSASGDFNNQILRFFNNLIVPNGVHKQPNLMELNVFPNPCHDYLHVKNENEYDNLAIYRIDGSKIKNIKKDQKSLDVSDLLSGIYLLSFDNGSRKHFTKFVKL